MKLISTRILFASLLLLVLIIPTVNATTVLFFGDTQISHNEGWTRDFPGNTTNVLENVTTIVSENYEFEYAWALGDMVSHASIESNEEMDEVWVAWWKNWEKIESKTKNKGFNTLIGNHDTCWDLNNNNRGVPLYYTYAIGNILFIVLSDLDTSGNEYNNQTGPGNLIFNNIDEIKYCNTTVQENQDKNIIILTHQATRGTTQNSDCCSNFIKDPEWVEMFRYFDKNNIHVDAHIHGHTHCGYPDDELIVERYNCTFIDASAGGSGSCDESQNFTGHVMFLNLTEGSDIARLDMLDITNYKNPTDWVDWSDNYGWQTYPRDLNLTYHFSLYTLGEQEIPSASMDQVSFFAGLVLGLSFTTIIGIWNFVKRKNEPKKEGTK